MPAILVNDQMCKRCGLCALDCPMGNLECSEARVPHFAPGAEGRCILCGHCEAVCPSGALVVEDPRLEPRTYDTSDAQIAPERLEAYLRMRRSIRSYKETPVDRATVERLLDIVRYAPTGVNSQSVRWLVVHDTAELRRLTAIAVDWMRAMTNVASPLSAYFNFEALVAAWESGRDPICRNAPHLVLAYAHKDALSAQKDAIIGLAHLDVAAPAFGLGTCWAGIFQIALTYWEPLRTALDLPEGHEVIYPMMLGYPAVRYYRAPKRNPLSVTWR
jgi:nitroreductase/NAD-dependent dihydropyrimidine dehydrogenase PreA subunit